MALRKYKYPAWLHADMEHLQNRIFNYVYHKGASPVDRIEIQEKWNKIKNEMDIAMEEIDKVSSMYSVKVDSKVAIRTPKA